MYLEGIAKSLAELHFATPESYAKQGVNVHLSSDVISFDADAKTITVKTPEGERQDSYDKLILSPGGYAPTLSVEGIDLDNIYHLRGKDCAVAIKERMQTAKQAVVIGAGYIGIEAAEAFALAGIKVTIIDALDRILSTNLDREFTDILEADMRKRGLQIQTGENVTAFRGENGAVTGVTTNHGTYAADMVILAIGVKPDTDWLQGLVALDDHGFVEVNEHMQSSVPDVYVGGDATLMPYHPTGGKLNIGLATNARRQGVVAGKHASGDDRAVISGVSGTSGLRVFDYKFASTGIGASNAALMDEAVESTYVEEKLLGDYMHHPVTVYMKIYYTAKDKRILGAQLMSTHDVTPAINTISVAIAAQWTLADLAQADFFFQPEFNRPWNYLNVLAMTALDELSGADQMLF